MKKLLLACSLALVSVAASAQNLKGTSINDRLANKPDSADALGSLSLYQDAFKRQSYIEALEPWEFVFHKAPLSMVRVYTDGAWMFETLIQQETDAEKKKEYFDKLMAIYDQRLKYLDALNSFATAKTTSTKGNILCRKAYDYYYFCPTMDNETAYKMFKEDIDDMGPNTEGFVLYAFIDCSNRRFLMNKDNVDVRQDFITDYMNTNDICDRLLDQAKEYPSETIPADPESEDSTKWVEQIILAPEAQTIVDNYQPVQYKANDLFVSSGAADCDALERIYGAQVEANKTNLQYLNSVFAESLHSRLFVSSMLSPHLVLKYTHSHMHGLLLPYPFFFLFGLSSTRIRRRKALLRTGKQGTSTPSGRAPGIRRTMASARSAAGMSPPLTT